MDPRHDPGSPATVEDAAGRRRVNAVLDQHDNAAVAFINPASNLGDARELLAASGIDIGRHAMLRGKAAAEFVVPTDAWLVGAAATDATAHGQGTRAVHLRDGRGATLHLVRVAEPHLAGGFVMVLVPDSGGTLSNAPAPSASEHAARVGVLYADGTGVVTRAEDSTLSMLGLTRAEIEGHSVISFAHPDDHEEAVARWIAGKEQRGVAHRWPCRVIRGDGSLLWIEATLTNRIDDFGAGDVRVEFNDVSREVAAAAALAEERTLLKQLTEALPVGVARFDAEGRIEYSNGRLQQLLGRDPAAVVADAIAGAIPELAKAFSQVLEHGEGAQVMSARRTEQFDRDLEWTLRPVASEAGPVTGGVLCVADVTEATELRAALEQRATTDALTGCLNWVGTISCVETALVASSPGVGVGLLFIDLNGFKVINDDHGHAIGNRVLEIVARRLRRAVRPPDKIGRLGGDEFVVIAPGLASLEATAALAARVSTEINTPASIADLGIDISASVGIAWADSGDADELLANADHAMYAVKCGTAASAARA